MKARSGAAQGRVFDGWFVVASVFVLLMVNSGFGFYGLAVYLEAITDEQGLSTSSVSLATSIFFVVSAVAGRLIAPIIERRDLRIVVAIGAAVAAIGLVLIGRSTRLLTLYPAYIVFAVGVGLSGLVPATTLVTRWFHVKRSVALSIASTGLSVGGLTFTVLASSLIDSRGMRDATPWLAVVYVAFVLVSLVTLWPSPAARGMSPDGRSRDAPAEQPTGMTYDRAIRTRFFVLVTLGFILAMSSQVGGIAQLAKLGSERVDTATGTLLVSSVAFASVIARLIGGVVASRLRLIVMTLSLSAAQGVALWWLSQAQSRLSLVVAALLFGCTIGNLLMLQPLVIADRFGVVNYPRIFALNQMVVLGFGVAVGPYLLGALHDLASYEASYLAAGGLSFAGALVFAAAAKVEHADTGGDDSVVEGQVSLAGASVGDRPE